MGEPHSPTRQSTEDGLQHERPAGRPGAPEGKDSMRNEWNHNPDSQSRAKRRWLLDELYPVPDSLRSDEERERYCHEDLSQLTTEELQLERAQVVFRLTFDGAPHPWLLERLDEIDARLRDAA